MSAIRPDLSSFASVQAPAPDRRANDAQAAFFRMALGQSAPSAAQATTAQTVAPQMTAPSRPATAPDPERPLRPGSLLDIRI